MPWLTLCIGVLCLIIALGILGEAPYRRANMLNQWLGNTARKLNGVRYTTCLTPEGIEYSTSDARALYRWNHVVHSIVETTHHIFICLLPTGAFVIPKRAFAASADAASFAAAAREFLNRAGRPNASQSLLAYLAVNDEPCPACGYNLRAITQPRCPECGRQIAGEDIPGFVKFGPPAPMPGDGTTPQAE